MKEIGWTLFEGFLYLLFVVPVLSLIYLAYKAVKTKNWKWIVPALIVLVLNAWYVYWWTGIITIREQSQQDQQIME